MTREELFELRLPEQRVEAGRRTKERWNALAKPLDGLGRFEEIFARIGEIDGTEEIALTPRSLLVFCADNGIVAEGVSQSGQEVTAVVAASLGDGSSNVCRMAERCAVQVIPVDIGIAGGKVQLKDAAPDEILPGHSAELRIAGVRSCPVRRGTRDFLREAALTETELLRAIAVGRELAHERAAAGDKLLALGEMGIGNTTSSAAVISALTGLPAEQTAGRGAGLSDAGLQRKRALIEAALLRHGLKEPVYDTAERGPAAKGMKAETHSARPEGPEVKLCRGKAPRYRGTAPEAELLQGDALRRARFERGLAALRCVGGLDIAGMVGAMIGAAERRLPLVLDGLITAAAALAAEQLCPGICRFMLASHRGREKGFSEVCRILSLHPVIDADMALGEGSGAVMLFPLLDLAGAVYSSGRSFESIQLSPYRRLC